VEIRFPVFVRAKDSGEVTQYASIAAMQYHFEKIDIENHEYEAWDANAVPLSLSVQQPIWLRVEPHPSAKPRELAAAIAEFAQRSGISVDQSSLLAGKFEPALDAIQQKLIAKRRSRRWLARFLRAK
jgi:hypothetical protein